MIVCIAEKPSVARDIASVLGATRRVGSSGCGYMEGNGYRVTWTFGHLCTLKEPEDYASHWRRWALTSLPIIPERFGIKAIESEHYLRQLDVIAEILKDAELVVNCGDAGQEGELIQRWVLQKCGNKAPVKRLWISSLTNEAIAEGFAHLKDEQEYQSLYEAGLARAIGDWLLGINATRLYTTRFAQRGQVLSIGRVQTPTLSLIVERQRAIDNFRPEPYWELHTTYRGVGFASTKGRISKQATAEELLRRIEGKELTITGVSKKAGKEAPPKLFDLTGLQVACNKKFGLSAEETLATIQTLYERKLTTYPRVDTTYLSDDIYPKCTGILTGLVAYRHLTAPLLAEKSLRKSKKVFDNSKITDHHAIIPTGQPVHGLSDREQKVFDLIAKHFIAVFYPDCQFSTTAVQAECEGIGFKTSGKEILTPGWRAVFAQAEQDSSPSNAKPKGEDEDSSGDEERQLPSFSSGESGTHSPEIKTKQTQPPKYYTEATLLRAMESAGKDVEDEKLREAMKENGIGRPSTRANIIETLFKRNYIERSKRKNIQATAQGIQLIDTIKNDLLKSAELTGHWERKLRQIERKELEAGAFISELKELAHTIVGEVIGGGSSAGQASTASTQTPPQPSPRGELVIPEDAPLCPLCHEGRVIRGRTSYGCSAYRAGCTYRISFEDFDASLRSDQVESQAEEAPLSLF